MERSRRARDAGRRRGEGGGVGERDVGLVVRSVARRGAPPRARAEWARALQARERERPSPGCDAGRRLGVREVEAY